MVTLPSAGLRRQKRRQRRVAARELPLPAAVAPPPTPAAEAAPSTAVNTNLEMLATIRGAIDAGRVDVHLQPTVTLPQRKVRFYEAMSRLRTQSGEVVPRRASSARRKPPG